MTEPKVILFDVNETLLDLGPVNESVGNALGGRPELATLWFTTMLQYGLVTTVADRYRNFDEIGAACLRMVAKQQGIELDEAGAKQVLAPIRSLPAHADVIPALERLQQEGHRLLTLTNSSTAVLAEQMRNSGLERFFESTMSVEEVGFYKPHTHLYRWAARHVGVDVSECLFVAAHGWDVAGAAWAGMKTAFVARPGKEMFPLGPAIDIVVPSFAELPEAVTNLYRH
ncbi:MAG: haloacid dehalogenase type II [Candidatus Paceibacterota bacterium]